MRVVLLPFTFGSEAVLYDAVFIEIPSYTAQRKECDVECEGGGGATLIHRNLHETVDW